MSDSLLKELLLEYDKKRTKAFVNLEEKKSNLYQKIPELFDIDKELNQFSISTAKSILSSHSKGDEIELLKKKLDELKLKKNSLLKKIILI